MMQHGDSAQIEVMIAKANKSKAKKDKARGEVKLGMIARAKPKGGRK